MRARQLADEVVLGVNPLGSGVPPRVFPNADRADPPPDR